jgi:hypothetical protein
MVLESVGRDCDDSRVDSRTSGDSFFVLSKHVDDINARSRLKIEMQTKPNQGVPDGWKI